MLPMFPMLRTMRAVKFLFLAPFILLMLVIVNAITSPGDWWVQWAALGLGIAWVVSLFRVARAAVLLGGLAALGAWLMRDRRARTAPSAQQQHGEQHQPHAQ